MDGGRGGGKDGLMAGWIDGCEYNTIFFFLVGTVAKYADRRKHYCLLLAKPIPLVALHLWSSSIDVI